MDRKTIYINSTERDIGGSDDSFTITRVIQEFPYPPKSAKLVTAAIPYTWDNITFDNNSFSIFETGTGTFDLTIPEGNYSGAQLATAVETAINTSGFFSQTYTVTYDSTTLKFTFTTAPLGMQIIFTEPGSAATLLGFMPGSTNPGVAATSVTSTVGAQILPDYEIFICSDLVQGSDNGVMKWFPSYTPTVSNQSQILARVPITAGFSTVLNYCAHPQLPFYSVTQSLFGQQYTTGTPVSISFFLALPSGLPLSLNGYHWSAEIVLDFDRTGAV